MEKRISPSHYIIASPLRHTVRRSASRTQLRSHLVLCHGIMMHLVDIYNKDEVSAVSFLQMFQMSQSLKENIEVIGVSSSLDQYMVYPNLNDWFQEFSFSHC